MAATITQIGSETGTNAEANKFFSSLALDMSGAVNIFIRQCLLRGGLPFSLEVPKPGEEIVFSEKKEG